MNTKLASLLAALVLCTGCLSTQQKCAPGDTVCEEGNRQERLLNLALALRDVAEVGTRADMIANPHHRPAFEKAVVGLRVLETKNPIELRDIANALLESGIVELKGKDAQLAVIGSQILFNRAGNLIRFENKEEVQLLAGALREGIEAGLGKS